MMAYLGGETVPPHQAAQWLQPVEKDNLRHYCQTSGGAVLAIQPGVIAALRKHGIALAMLFSLSIQCDAATPHPRIFLDVATLGALRNSTSGSAQWSALREHCDAYLPGVVYPGKSEQGRYDYFAPKGDYARANSGNPNIGLGYQGGGAGKLNGYWDSIMNLGLCYNVILPSNPGRAEKYAAKAFEILDIISTAPGEAQVLTGKKAGQKRYIYDSSFVTGTAWTGATPVVDGAVAARSKSIPVRGFTPGGTIKAGDMFHAGGKVFIVKSDTKADDRGSAALVLGTVHVAGSVNSNESVPVALPDGTAVTTPLIVESYQHNLASGDQVRITGVLGNTNVNGTWTITLIDNFRFILNGAPPGNALQTNLAHDCLVNQGYGARYYGVAIAIGYDWFYDAITPELRAKLRAAAVRWIRETERNGYGQAHPAGNYYAGQFIAKLFAALALEGDDPEGDALWNSWYNNEWVATARTYSVADEPRTCKGGDCPGVQKYFNTYLVDTAHPDGANYGWLATQNYLWAVAAVQSAKGIDLTTTPAPGFGWGLSAAKGIIHHTWPNRTTFNTRQKLFNGEDPARLNADALYTISGYLRRYHPDFAPYFQSYAKETVEALRHVAPFSAKAPFGDFGWNEFLFWNPHAPATDYKTLPLSFYSAGSGELEMRSDWTTSAVWASFIAGPNVHSVEGGKDNKDRGSIAISRGGQSFLANASFELDKARKVVYADNLTLGEGVPQITNTFHVNSGARWRQGYYGPGAIDECMKPNRSSISRRSEQAEFVYGRASFLEDNFYPIGYPSPTQETACGGTKAVTSWTRDLFYLRPELFLAYDQTKIADPSYDQFVAWHFIAGASLVSSEPGLVRYDIKSGRSFKGSMFSILPEDRKVQLIDEGGFGVVDRLEVRPPTPAGPVQRWLTAFDLATAADRVHSLSVLHGSNCDGVQVADIHTVVAFARESPQKWPLVYDYNPATTQQYVVGLTPGAKYAITVQAGQVSITPGEGRAADAAGILAFSIAGGEIH